MFSNLKQLFNRSNKDLRKRIYFTLFCLGIFILGSTITLNWTTLQNEFEELEFLQIFNLMAGGGLQHFSIFALGVSPYITAQIITQLLQMDVIPYFKELKEQGYTGKQKINRITRYIGVAIALVQGYLFTVIYSGSTDVVTILKSTVVITAGTCLLLWIGDQITKRGIGNGLSLMIMAGIIQSMPSIFTAAFKALTALSTNKVLGGAIFASFVILYLLIIVGMVWIQLAERRIPIQYANRTNSAYGRHQSFLPIRINSAGVMPVIFATTLLAIPATIINFTKNATAIEFADKFLTNTAPGGFVIYILLILFFGYFYTFLQMNPEEMAKNLNKSGAYIPGVRPGNDTVDYISDVLSKLTIVGSIFLVIIAGLPIIFSGVSGLDARITIGGTGLLIVVGVAIETYKQLESSLISRSHRAGIKR